MQLEGLSISDSLRPLLPYTAMISVKDAKGTADHPQYRLPGDGTINYEVYFRLLKEWHYPGFVSVEVSRMIFEAAGYDPVRTAHLCYNRLKPAFRSSGLQYKYPWQSWQVAPRSFFVRSQVYEGGYSKGHC